MFSQKDFRQCPSFAELVGANPCLPEAALPPGTNLTPPGSHVVQEGKATTSSPCSGDHHFPWGWWWSCHFSWPPPALAFEGCHGSSCCPCCQLPWHAPGRTSATDLLHLLFSSELTWKLKGCSAWVLSLIFSLGIPIILPQLIKSDCIFPKIYKLPILLIKKMLLFLMLGELELTDPKLIDHFLVSQQTSQQLVSRLVGSGCSLWLQLKLMSKFVRRFI